MLGVWNGWPLRKSTVGGGITAELEMLLVPSEHRTPLLVIVHQGMEEQKIEAVQLAMTKRGGGRAITASLCHWLT